MFVNAKIFTFAIRLLDEWNWWNFREKDSFYEIFIFRFPEYLVSRREKKETL